MALLFCDGFDHYNVAHLLEKWDTLQSQYSRAMLITTPGRNPGTTYNNYLGVTWGNALSKNLPNSTTLTVGFAFMPDVTATPSGQLSIPLCAFYDQSKAQIQVNIMESGQLQFATVATNGSLNVLGYSPSNSVHTGTYTYIEIQVTFSTTATGSIAVQINGQAVLSLTGIITAGTANSYANIFTLFGTPTSSSASYAFDDLYICDGTGTYNNTFLGDVRVALALPNGNGLTNSWSETGGTAGQNYTAVDEVPPDDDTSYVYSSTVNQVDAYTISSIGTVSAIAAVQLVACARKTDSASRVIGLGFGNATSDVFDSGHSVSSSYLMARSTLDSNPVTASAWGASDLSGAQIALKVIS